MHVDVGRETDHQSWRKGGWRAAGFPCCSVAMMGVNVNRHSSPREAMAMHRDEAEGNGEMLRGRLFISAQALSAPALSSGVAWRK